MASQSPEFTKAVADSKNLQEKPSNDELLQLYALYKVANGEKFDPANQPGVFALKEKAKFNAWKKEAEAGTSAEDAQKKYVVLVESLKTQYGFSEQPTATGTAATATTS